MKKIILLLGLVFVLTGCGNKVEEKIDDKNDLIVSELDKYVEKNQAKYLFNGKFGEFKNFKIIEIKKNLSSDFTIDEFYVDDKKIGDIDYIFYLDEKNNFILTESLESKAMYFTININKVSSDELGKVGEVVRASFLEDDTEFFEVKTEKDIYLESYLTGVLQRLTKVENEYKDQEVMDLSERTIYFLSDKKLNNEKIVNIYQNIKSKNKDLESIVDKILNELSWDVYESKDYGIKFNYPKLSGFDGECLGESYYDSYKIDKNGFLLNGKGLFFGKSSVPCESEPSINSFSVILNNDEDFLSLNNARKYNKGENFDGFYKIIDKFDVESYSGIVFEDNMIGYKTILIFKDNSIFKFESRNLDLLNDVVKTIKFNK